ncbi:MAG TPA: hypothetical protein VFQ59_00065 [Candidatus Paceibacterota bacterium]|nr:hypothetical protein [Candidatus Paceibacterota bacterium]
MITKIFSHTTYRIFASLILSVVFSFFFSLPLHAAENSINVNLDVTSCNINGICEPELGENIFTCPSECLSPTVTGSYPVNQTVFFRNVLVTTFFNKAIITWQSSIPTLTTVRWGKTIDYNDGSLRTLVYTKNHRIEITGLTPDTLYYAEILSTDAFNRSLRFGAVPFLTLPSAGSIPNPTHVRADTVRDGIFLSWINPTYKNFEYIRILKNTWEYPKDPFSGTLVYEGTAQSFLDKNVEVGKKYFYSLFARSKEGNFSSGVFVSAGFVKDAPSSGEITSPDGTITDPSDPDFGSQRRRPTWIERGDFVPAPVSSFFSMIWTLIISLFTTLWNFFKGLYFSIISLF